MLEVKNLTKIYKLKKSVPVTALKGVNLKLADTGMVFLLGKSGSGKSTLLNLLGGLDRYDDGEIIINGTSSSAFKQSDFDSYRNTYVGFIFQEYNILEEFNVGANIAIALELQGKKATDEQINKILNQVDLDGYGNRKPNELSGGQKQRVAIARALVKSPEIIMADEPTGALDSNTGKQVLDTLKKLSREKLVIVVSHDREFAENYADRIIELADGEIINDVTVDNFDNSADKNNGLIFGRENITVLGGYHLTQDDLIKINAYIDGINGKEIKILPANTKAKNFKSTDIDKIISNNKKFKLIKSRLPVHNAFKMGAGGLKHKKIRLVITILLSCIAFGLFGLSDTFAAYNHVKVCTNSIYDTGIDYASVNKSKKFGKDWYEGIHLLSDEDIKSINENTDVKMNGVFYPINSNLSFETNTNNEIKTTESEYDIYRKYFSGYTQIDENIVKNSGYKMIAGRYPDGAKDEIAISKYMFDVFKKAQYTDGELKNDAKGNKVLTYQEIKTYSDLLEKQITVNNIKYTVVGIVDTNLDMSRYLELIEKKENMSTAEQLVDYALFEEFISHFNYSMASCIMVGRGKIETMLKSKPPISHINNGYMWFYADEFSVDPNYLTTIDKLDASGIIWLDGERKTLAENEIIAFEDSIGIYDEGKIIINKNDINEDGTAQIGEDGNKIDYVSTFKKVGIDCTLSGIRFGDDDYKNTSGYKIVGIIPADKKYADFDGTAVVSKELFDSYVDNEDGIYDFAIGVMPQSKEEIKTLVGYCYDESGTVKYPLRNSVTFELDMINEELKEFSKIFLYIGLGFALFAAVMLANFITTSISYKKQEIGILRAIGSRSNDVFRIFFAESFIIAIINFFLSAIGVFTVTQILNVLVRKNLGILITLLTFSPRQVLLLLFVSLIVAFAASYIPVKRIASKKPIDAIRNR